MSESFLTHYLTEVYLLLKIEVQFNYPYLEGYLPGLGLYTSFITYKKDSMDFPNKGFYESKA
ncbi:MAG: hypothetical protein ABIS01_02885 [Ferruginibacter sp.]